jgi:hypothetical protein
MVSQIMHLEVLPSLQGDMGVLEEDLLVALEVVVVVEVEVEIILQYLRLSQKLLLLQANLVQKPSTPPVVVEIDKTHNLNMLEDLIIPQLMFLLENKFMVVVLINLQIE